MDQFLIAHKVRGERAFDIANKIECPICNGSGESEAEPDSDQPVGCEDCDGTGDWWIVSTSGHRAFPYVQWPFNVPTTDEPPDHLPDHYQAVAAKGEGKVSARDLLKNLVKREPIGRRGL